MTSHFKDPFVWFYGLISAVIGGAVNAATACMVAPEVFNLFHGGFAKVMELSASAGFVALILYLKQSPLPKLIEETTITQTITNTTTKETTPVSTNSAQPATLPSNEK